MSATTATKFYFSDWQSDASLRASSLAARGLWMELLAVAHQNKGKDRGFVVIAGRKPSIADLARLSSSTVEEIDPLLKELEKNGVFNVDRRGIIYSKQIVRKRRPLSAVLRDFIFQRDGRVCRYCFDETGPFQIDHIFPKAKGGSDDPENLAVACSSCNLSKRDKTLGEWLCQ